jgi:hypothetical protein
MFSDLFRGYGEQTVRATAMRASPTTVMRLRAPRKLRPANRMAGCAAALSERRYRNAPIRIPHFFEVAVAPGDFHEFDMLLARSLRFLRRRPLITDLSQGKFHLFGNL